MRNCLFVNWQPGQMRRFLLGSWLVGCSQREMPNPNAYLEHHLRMRGHRWIQGGSLEKTELVVEWLRDRNVEREGGREREKENRDGAGSMAFYANNDFVFNDTRWWIPNCFPIWFHMISLATAILYVMFGRIMFPSHRSLVSFPPMAKMLWKVHPPSPSSSPKPAGRTPPHPVACPPDAWQRPIVSDARWRIWGVEKNHLYRIGCCCLHIKVFINTPLELPHFFVGLPHPFIQLSTVINCRYMPK